MCSTATTSLTATTWCARVRTSLLYGGRLATLRDAILVNDRHRQTARNRFAGPNGNRKGQILEFLDSLLRCGCRNHDVSNKKPVTEPQCDVT
jgi:hypothetical protein